ncbi:hypothetical protein L2E82_49719 [Cichorium intybus]|uniref:Uncharacterized protein n=1 Tax=Cichorium intybus TaxID=13427 RepID=A0ACB8Z0V8_CICIN|nr:hypothetical protein L2E82_49719 [Cichorium intybus]
MQICDSTSIAEVEIKFKNKQLGYFRRSRAIKGKRALPSCKEKQIVKEGQVICYVEQLGGDLPIEANHQTSNCGCTVVFLIKWMHSNVNSRNLKNVSVYNTIHLMSHSRTYHCSATERHIDYSPIGSVDDLILLKMLSVGIESRVVSLSPEKMVVNLRAAPERIMTGLSDLCNHHGRTPLKGRWPGPEMVHHHQRAWSRRKR